MNILNNSNMEPEVIREILRRYFEGESSGENEHTLKEYFRSGNVEAELLPYRDFFLSLEELKGQEYGISEDELTNFIEAAEQKRRTLRRRLYSGITGVAAAVLVAIILTVSGNKSGGWEDTYSDPDQAYATASLAVNYVVEKYTAEISKLQRVNKLNRSVKPVTEGFGLLNKGFNEIENLRNILTEIEQ